MSHCVFSFRRDFLAFGVRIFCSRRNLLSRFLRMSDRPSDFFACLDCTFNCRSNQFCRMSEQVQCLLNHVRIIGFIVFCQLIHSRTKRVLIQPCTKLTVGELLEEPLDSLLDLAKAKRCRRSNIGIHRIAIIAATARQTRSRSGIHGVLNFW